MEAPFKGMCRWESVWGLSVDMFLMLTRNTLGTYDSLVIQELDNFAHSHIVARDADQDQQHTQQRKLCTDFTHGTLFKSKLEA